MKTAVVIAFERLPLRQLGCYGRIPSLTPRLDRFAAESVVFDWHFAENVDGDAANHAWWTGRYQFPIPPAEQQQRPQTLLDALAAAGIEIGGIEGGSRRSEGGGRKAGVGKSLEILHPPTSDLRSPTSNLRAIDEALGHLIESLQARQRSTGDELLIVVTAATGARAAGSDANPLPQDVRQIAECSVHTPLIVHSSNGDGGLRQSSLVQSVDLAPTLLEWFGLCGAGLPFEGRSLLPLLRHDAVAPGRESVFYGDGLRCCGIRTREFRLLAPRAALETEPGVSEVPSERDVPSGVRLFVNPDDPWEVHDVAEQEPETAARLLTRLREFLAQRASHEAGCARD
jgi:arylsulfatase A-like enzyme